MQLTEDAVSLFFNFHVHVLLLDHTGELPS